MGSFPPFSNSLTGQDQEHGFMLALIPNPNFQYVGHSSLSLACILPVSDSPTDRIVKFGSQQNEPVYQHQAFGTYKPLAIFANAHVGEPKWLPVGNTYLTADEVMIEMQYRQERSNRVQVDRAAPFLQLRCPKCAEAFRLPRPHLLPDEEVSCNHCGIRISANEAADTNAL